ncbi:MAG: DnaJ domain-containing protein [Hyalangium sp.]|uniref:DnaJ domain-containing protein n=1 Tax=Hyalangium sp. TaxID=2028555 RepID=UPI00389B27AC
MAEGEVRQYFVRNDKGTLWGPLTLTTIELLIDNGVIQGRVQVSEDGLHFAFPGRFPHLRDAFPRELWGDVIAPGETVQVAKAELPPEMMGQRAPVPPAGSAPSAAGAAPMAGPGAISQAAAPRPGPGAMAQSSAPRPGPGAMSQTGIPAVGPGAVPRGPAPMAPPGAPAQAAGPRPGPSAGAQPGAPVAGPGARPAAPPVAGPGNPSGSFRPVAPASAGPRPPPAAAPAGAAPIAPPAPAAAATQGAQPVMTPSGIFTATASPPVPPAQGSLDQLSPVALYGRIAAGSLTGLLTLSLADRSIQLHFRKGSPEFVDSSHPEDALGPMLTQAKLLTPEQLQQAEGARGRFGGELLAALFGLGLLQPATAFNHLSQRALSILHKGLRAESGTFTYEPKELPAAKAMPLGNKWAVLSDQIRRLPAVDLKRRLQPVLTLPIMKSEGVVATSDLRLTPHEVRMLTFVDGARSLAQLLTDFAQDSEYLMRLAFLLKELDAVSFAAVSQRAPEPKAAAPKPAAPQPPQASAPAAAPRPAAPNPPAAAAPKPAAPNPPPAAAAAPKPAAPVIKPSAPAAAPAPGAPAKPSAPAAPQAGAPAAAATPASGSGAEDLPALRQTAATMKGQNHFERLSLTDQADASAVKVAYFKLAKLYHPDTLPPGAPPELEKLKAEIFGYIGDAYRTLTDDKSRKDYLEQLKAGDSGKEEVDVVAILQSEERFKKGMVFVKARKYAEAVSIFDEAIKLNPAEPEFQAWRGYARFCAATDKKAAMAESFREIQGAIKKNDRCAPAHYFLGVIAKTLGDLSGAQKHFKRTVELQPDHIDALREIRMAAQKK